MPKKQKKKTASTKAKAKKKVQRFEKNDIIQLILEDHKPLKRLIKVMKNDELSLGEREKAFEEFAPLLVAHAKPEEEILYTYMKKDEDLREEGFEGEVEHQLADQMVEESKRTRDDDQLGARIKVLAELVEHHIEEEEEELLPDFKKNSEAEERVQMGDRYLRAKAKIEAEGSDDAPSQKDMPREKTQSNVQRAAMNAKASRNQ